MRLRIVPYKRGSESAKMLSEALSLKFGHKVLRGKPKEKCYNLFWGLPPDKLANFEKFENAEVPHVPYTASKETAQKWLEKGFKVLARTTGGQAGSGITVVEPGDEIPDRPLYTAYIKKRKEFRVHVFDGQVIDVQEKRKKIGEEANPLIRNHENGWVFCHEDIVEPDGLRDAAIRAVGALGLLFGAVDVIWNEKKNQCWVLEVNSAPGLTPTTAEKYADAIYNGLQPSK